MFVVATIIFYEMTINRKNEMAEHHTQPGGSVPAWVRYFTLLVTVIALIATFWVSIGQHRNTIIHAREHMQNISTPAQQVVVPVTQSQTINSPSNKPTSTETP
ncbi:hypothetical protein LPW36_11465 [Jinshanibacter sp. LJY008]|uniref:Uncharacterized protein n=1 Tax=Limnobaculum eriocheiris TaxID=2897391 RepID=A0A9X1SQ02_9GAMM|nr:hypothetical protein [Limnobaculum eriocheiris]MCD1126607.1 hypothetical protein [Limnobaculum eriocheiris]